MASLINALPTAIALGLIWGLLAVGVYITYKVLNFSDLAVDGTIVTGASVMTVLMINGVNVYVSLIVATLLSGLAGLLTGLLHTKLGIPAILSGILTQLVLYSVNLKVMGKANLPLSSRNYHTIISQLRTPVSIIVLLAIIIAVVLILYWFFGTQLGSSIRATGNNETMAKTNGINTDMTKVLGLVISNSIIGLAGGLLTQYQGFVDINMGKGGLVIGLASIIIGETLLSRISRNFAFRLFCAVFGGVCYYIIYQIVIFTGIDTDLLKMLSAVIVAVFLAVPYLKENIKLKKKENK